MGKSEGLIPNEYFILSEISLSASETKDAEQLKKELKKLEKEILDHLKTIIDTKPNFEIHLKKVLDKLYSAQNFVKYIENSKTAGLYLESYHLFESELRKTYGRVYDKCFNPFHNIFGQSSTNIFSIKCPEWANDENFKSEAFFKKQKINEYFSSYKAYSFFIELKRLLCDNEHKNKLVEYSYIYRKMHSEKLINDSISESIFRINFLDKYFKETDLDKLKTLSNSKTKHRDIIYDLVKDKFKPN